MFYFQFFRSYKDVILKNQSNKNNPIDEETTSNLKFLIGIRHEIEHQMTNKIDSSISAKLQACSINYNYYIKMLFGEEYGVDKDLGLVIQFSPITPVQKGYMLNNDKLTTNVKNFISEFEDNLSDENIRSQKYAYRLLFTPLIMEVRRFLYNKQDIKCLL